MIFTRKLVGIEVMNKVQTIIIIAWFVVIAIVAVAGAWKLGHGGGWLIVLAFLMALGTKVSFDN